MERKQGALEVLVMNLFNNIYKGKRVFITGHNGFKGSWLTAWLKMLGAEIYGFSLPNNEINNHWKSLNTTIKSDFEGNILDSHIFNTKLKEANPHIIFHLAAQPLVRRSYVDPSNTWETNLMGTLNLLESSRYLNSLEAIVIVTSDKCYLNEDERKVFNELDSLGGHDPYSASKAAVEILTASYRKSFFNLEGTPLIASARAGNVIGGGDWAVDRIVPDLVRSIQNHEVLEIRYPKAIRPWQHVLDCISGYLALGRKLLDKERKFADAWNFGPNIGDERNVETLLLSLKDHLKNLEWTLGTEQGLHEASFLQLDCSKAKKELLWEQVWSYEESIKYCAEWYELFLEDHSILTTDQIKKYIEDADKKNLNWIN